MGEQVCSRCRRHEASPIEPLKAASLTRRAFEAGSFLSTEHETYGIHPVCLAGWGLPIGELFDLEALSEKCAELRRWTFFMTSEVLNVPGGVASPPNALAIF